MKTPLIAVLLLAGWAAADEPLKKAGKEAGDRVAQEKEERISKRKSLERLQKDLHYMSEELDRDTLGPRRDLQGYSEGALVRIKRLRETGNIDKRLEPTLELLEQLYKDLPNKEYAKEYSGSLAKAIGRELRWIADGKADHCQGDEPFAEEGDFADEPRDEETIMKLLETNLAVPDSAPDDSSKALALFPTDLTLKQFKKLGPIRIFLVKHRISAPKKGYVKTDVGAILERKHNVQIGVEVSGEVNYASLYFWDQDYTFNIGHIHMEITPEWRILYKLRTGRDFPLPKVGDRIKVKGWTYFDIFHKAEGEYDPGDPVMGLNRKTQWEVHPVLEIETLP